MDTLNTKQYQDNKLFIFSIKNNDYLTVKKMLNSSFQLKIENSFCFYKKKDKKSHDMLFKLAIELPTIEIFELLLNSEKIICYTDNDFDILEEILFNKNEKFLKLFIKYDLYDFAQDECLFIQSTYYNGLINLSKILFTAKNVKEQLKKHNLELFHILNKNFVQKTINEF